MSKHEIVHPKTIRGKLAGARKRGQFNRRVFEGEKFFARGSNYQKTLALVEKEKNYHFTKGYRTRSV